jgi:thiol-disulfide isomerase/thioredoxin
MIITSVSGTLKEGDKFFPFSLIGVDQKTVTASMEEGRLVLITEYTEDNEKLSHKTYPDSILIDFWATWCVPCRAAMPSMQKLYDKYVPKEGLEQGGLGLFGIALDTQGSKIVKPFYEKLKFTYPMLCEPTEGPDSEDLIRSTKNMKSLYKIQGIPVVYLIDSKGIIQHVHVGFKEKDFEKLDGLIKTLTAGD